MPGRSFLSSYGGFGGAVPVTVSSGQIPSVWPASPLGIVADGDSITVGQVDGVSPPFYGYVAPAVLNFPGGYGGFTNIAVSGETIATMLSNISSNVAPLISSAHSAGRKAVCSCFGGTNDFHAGTSESTVFSSVTSYFQTCNSDGADYCICFTILPRGDSPSTETSRISFNSALVSGYTSIASNVILCDLGNDPSMGGPGQDNNTTLYSEGSVHPSIFGYSLLANHWAAAVMSIGSTCTLTGLSVATGAQAGGTSVTLTGTNFAGVVQVVIGGIPAASFTVVSPTTITAVTGAAYNTGVGNCYVLGSHGSGTLRNSWTWT